VAPELEVDARERGNALEGAGDADGPERAGPSAFRGNGCLGQWIFAGEDAVIVPTTFALLSLTRITR
jgi:hypothetical protein